jgi:integrase
MLQTHNNVCTKATPAWARGASREAGNPSGWDRERDPKGGAVRRHHLNESGLRRPIKAAGQAAGITKRVNSHCLRPSFATDLLEAGYDIRTVQELLGHKDVATTMIYALVLNRPGVLPVKSPADVL